MIKAIIYTWKHQDDLNKFANFGSASTERYLVSIILFCLLASFSFTYSSNWSGISEFPIVIIKLTFLQRFPSQSRCMLISSYFGVSSFQHYRRLSKISAGRRFLVHLCEEDCASRRPSIPRPALRNFLKLEKRLLTFLFLTMMSAMKSIDQTI